MEENKLKIMSFFHVTDREETVEEDCSRVTDILCSMSKKIRQKMYAHYFPEYLDADEMDDIDFDGYD